MPVDEEMVKRIAEAEQRLERLEAQEISGIHTEPHDAHLNNPSCRVRRSTNLNTANGVMTAVTFSHERWDTDAMYAGAQNYVEIKTDGIYQINGHLAWDADAGGGLRIIQIRCRISAAWFVIAEDWMEDASVWAIAKSIGTQYKLTVSDRIQLRGQQNSGGNLNIMSIARYSPDLAVTRIG